MEAIIKYKAIDGREFKDEVDCLKYEKGLVDIKILMSNLPKLPTNDKCSFANGNGYIQHDAETYNTVKEGFYKLACNFHKSLKEYPIDSYGFWRTLDDSISPFYSAGQRILNTDEKTYREYGQPYYKNNPQHVKGGRIN